MSANTLHRRSVLGLLAGAFVAAGAWLYGLFPPRVQQALAARFPTRTVEVENFDFDAKSGEIVWDGGRREKYALVIDGLVEEPVRLSYEALRALPRRDQISDFHCVEGWSLQDVPWGGVAFSELLKLVQLKEGAQWLVFHSIGNTEHSPRGAEHYTESFPIAELIDPKLEYMLALDLEGNPLPLDRGAPARVVCPFDLAYKSIKFVRRIEVVQEGRPGWWTLANPIYPMRAPVQKNRLRKPDPRSS